MRILVTGGAGYVGSKLTARLLAEGHQVVVYDLFIYGALKAAELLDIPVEATLLSVHGDIRDTAQFRRAVTGCDAVIHLACISNDISCELDPVLAESVNLDSFEPLLIECRNAGVKRFIFASSSSVYGVSSLPDVTEDTIRVPISDYNRYKSECEDILRRTDAYGICWTSVRPGTICGVSPRQRFDLVVNMLTAQAWFNGQITVKGGTQFRPCLHIDDVVDLYLNILGQPPETVNRKTYNAAYENLTVVEIAEMVKAEVDSRSGHERVARIVHEDSNDPRSYRINSDLAVTELGWEPCRSVEDAIWEICDEFESGRLFGALTDPVYHNVKQMLRIGMK